MVAYHLGGCLGVECGRRVGWVDFWHSRADEQQKFGLSVICRRSELLVPSAEQNCRNLKQQIRLLKGPDS